MKILIEKTPAYFVKSYVPRRIFFFNPSVKLIVLLRNPLDRLISDYDQVISFVSLCVCFFRKRIPRCLWFYMLRCWSTNIGTESKVATGAVQNAVDQRPVVLKSTWTREPYYQYPLVWRSASSNFFKGLAFVNATAVFSSYYQIS